MPQFRSMSCPACQESATHVLGQPDLSRDPVGAAPGTSIVACKACGHLRLQPMPLWSQDDFAKLYGDDYFVPDSPRWSTLRAVTNPSSRLARLLPLLSAPQKTVLEIGSGVYAHFCKLLLPQGWTVVAQEPSPTFQATLREAGLTVENRLFEDLPEDRKFAVLYADSVFEHVPDPGIFFDKASRLLEPGGVLYLVVPRERSLLGNLRARIAHWRGEPCPLLSAYKPPYHLHGFSPASMRHFAKRSGLRVGRIFLGEDWFWLQALEKLPPVVGHLVAGILWLADKAGLGGNLEVALIKDP